MPERLGNRYRVDRLIAEGGMARVYQGTDTILGRRVALKVLSAGLAQDPAFVTRFEREARAVASLNHPNLVGIYDIGADGELHYIVLEYVEGETLDAVIRREAPMPAGRVTSIALSVCEGLAVAHATGIVHRDIKPANVMIEPDGRVKVMDFGIAKTRTEGLTEVGSVLGTVKYLAPEQAYGRPVDGRADIYALGCVMYEMLTGRPPITGDTLMEVASRLATEDPVPPSELVPGIPDRLERVVLRALAKNPEHRYPDTATMARDLRGERVAPAAAVVAAAGSASAATIVQAPGNRTRVLPAPPPGNRWDRLALLAAAVLLIGAGAIALAANLLGGDEGPPAAQPPPPPPAASTSPSPAPTESPTPAHSPTPSESPSPTPGEPPEEEEAEGPDPAKSEALRAAGGRVLGILGAAVQSGAASDRAADNIMDEVDKAISEQERDDVEDALKAVEDARGEVDKYVGREELDPSVAGSVNAQLNQMAQILAS